MWTVIKQLQILAKIVWRNLEVLDLSMNYFYEASNIIRDGGCRRLVRAKWPHLKHLNLSKIVLTSDMNGISIRGCRYLSKTLWPKL